MDKDIPFEEYKIELDKIFCLETNNTKMEMETVTTYRPEYNPEKKQYEDVNPIPAYAKRFRYKCLCSHSTSIFTKSSDFTQHFKNKTHRMYVFHYETNIKDLTDANDRVLELQKNLEKKYNETQRLQREMKSQNEIITKLMRELDEFKKPVTDNLMD
jgi:peptidoglycan hydrolase CwlO-like protein